MIDKHNDMLFINHAMQNEEFTDGIVPDAEFNCVGHYRNPLHLEDLKSDTDLCECDILEIITDISIDIKNIINLINKTSLRLLDMGYANDGFHFLVRNAGGEGHDSEIF